MNCLYCNSSNVISINEHPYPYLKYNKDRKRILMIKKFVCKCGYPTFMEENKNSIQFYKQGLYEFKR